MKHIPMENQHKVIIGLTGNIASGKSTVAKMLQQLGANVVDADQVARQVVEVGTPALKELVSAFGDEICNSDGSLDRKKLGNMVFSDKAALEKLNKITHPRIRKVLQDILDDFRRKRSPGTLVVEAALLYETGLDKLVDQVWFVTAPVTVRVSRLMMRNDLTYEEAMKRIESQESEEMKRNKSDKVIYNDVDEEQLKMIVSEAYHNAVGINLS